MSSGVAPMSSISGVEMTNPMDWMDIFDNAEVLIGAENVTVAAEDISDSTDVLVNPSGELRTDSVQPCVYLEPTEGENADVALVSAADNICARKVVGVEDKKQARCERKRSREKQRRLDVNAQIAELTTVLQKVESEENDSEEAGFSTNTNPGNRVDLIGRTIAVLSRFHNENGKRQREITELQEKVKIAKKKLKLKEEQNIAVASQQTTPMIMPMINNNFLPLQSMMVPTPCVANPMAAMYNAMVQPKMFVDLTKPQSILQAPSAFPTTPVCHTVVQKTKAPPVVEKGLLGNLAHCA